MSGLFAFRGMAAAARPVGGGCRVAGEKEKSRLPSVSLATGLEKRGWKDVDGAGPVRAARVSRRLGPAVWKEC